MNRPITIINNGIIKSQQSINHQNHISLASTIFSFCFYKTNTHSFIIIPKYDIVNHYI